MSLTPANILTLSRLAAIPLYLYVLFGMDERFRVLALAIFGLAALTDFFDGYVARRSGTVTEFGKLADPFCDRALIISAVIALYIKSAGAIPLWAAVAVVGRDAIMLLGSTIFLANQMKLNIVMAGKVSTAVTLFGLFLLIFDGVAGIKLSAIAIPVFYAGVGLSLLTGLFYLVWGTRQLLGKQEARKITA